MNEQAKKATKRTRRWLKVSLRTFLLAITVLCVWLGFIVNRANKQKQAVAWVRDHGGFVVYADPTATDRLGGWIGIDYFENVAFVDLNEADIADITPLATLTKLDTLYLNGSHVRDLSPLFGMKGIKWLELNGTEVSDLSPLVNMIQMERLELNETHVSDLSPLAGMSRLTFLSLDRTLVSNISPLSEVRQLETLDLCGTQVSDLSPLIGSQSVTIHLNKNQHVNIPPTLESQIKRW